MHEAWEIVVLEAARREQQTPTPDNEGNAMAMREMSQDSASKLEYPPPF